MDVDHESLLHAAAAMQEQAMMMMMMSHDFQPNTPNPHRIVPSYGASKIHHMHMVNRLGLVADNLL